MKKLLLALLLAVPVQAQHAWLDVDTAVTVQVNRLPLTADGTTADTGVVYNETGLVLIWNFIDTAGVVTATAVTPTDTAGDYDWTNTGGGSGVYKIEIPASGGATINNDTEGSGWFTGASTANYIFAGPVIGFRAAAINDALVSGTTSFASDGVVLGATGVDKVLMSDMAAGAPSATATLKVAINWLYSFARNKRIVNVTDGEIQWFKDDTSTKLAEAPFSDDATNVTISEVGAVD